MNLSVALVSTFTLALLHTIIPSHWLCFVLVGRAQGWARRKTLTVTAVAGMIHVVANVTLGAALARVGHTLLQENHEHLLERISAATLIVLGVLYLGSHLLHAGHHHEKDHEATGRAAILTLSFSLAVSPCSASIMLLIAATAGSGWTTLLLIAAVLLVTTVGVMLFLVGLTSLGVERLQFTVFEKYEKLILGLVLCVLGTLILLFHR